MHAMKFESTRSLSRNVKHVRAATLEDDSAGRHSVEERLRYLETLIKGDRDNRRRETRRNFRITCWSCQKQGHIQRDCPTNKPSQSTQNQEN